MTIRQFDHVAAVLFDWDGTLLNSYESDLRAYFSAFRELGIQWELSDLNQHYSPDWYRVYRSVGLPQEKWDLADRLWRSAYEKEHPRLMPGARKVLRDLHPSVHMAIVSSGSGPRVRRQIEAFGLSGYFGACVCCEDAPHRKPHPAPLLRAIESLRLAPENCVYVGDAAEDIEMARSAGVAAVGVRGPFPTAERVIAAKPDVFLESVQELTRYLRNGNSTRAKRTKSRKRR